MSQLLTMRRGPVFGAKGSSRLRMKQIPWLLLLGVLSSLGPGAVRPALAAEDGVALAIVYDTSGSMNESVPDTSGRKSPKYVIANRALATVAQQLEAFATNTASGAPRKIDVGL